MEKAPLRELRISIRAQLLKDTFFRIYRLLSLHCRDLVVILIESVDEAYIKLNKIATEILITDGFDDLHSHYMSLNLPDSLFAIQYPDELWMDLQNNLNAFMGSINLICVEVGAKKRTRNLKRSSSLNLTV